MYENANQSWLEILLESESFSDMVNRAEYATEMFRYDRDMMQELKEARDAVEQQKKDLEEEKVNLETARQELKNMLSQVEEQKKAVNTAMAAKTREIAD